MNKLLLSLMVVTLSWSATVQAGNGEDVAFTALDLFKFPTPNNWGRRFNSNVRQVIYTCDGEDCPLHVDRQSGVNVDYECVNGAVVILLSNGTLLVPKECAPQV